MIEPTKRIPAIKADLDRTELKRPLPGDGIGPEIVEAVQIVLDGRRSPFVWDVRQAGMAAIQRVGDPLPPDTLQNIRRTKLALKGL